LTFYLQTDFPAFQAVSAVRPACGYDRPPHMANEDHSAAVFA